jgi:hypothetical protein
METTGPKMEGKLKRDRQLMRVPVEPMRKQMMALPLLDLRKTNYSRSLFDPVRRL